MSNTETIKTERPGGQVVRLIEFIAFLTAAVNAGAISAVFAMELTEMVAGKRRFKWAAQTFTALTSLERHLHPVAASPLKKEGTAPWIQRKIAVAEDCHAGEAYAGM